MLIRTKFNGYSADGIRLYYCDGGGSPAPAPAPAATSQTVTNTSIPEYAQPYVERLLGKAEAFSNAPYQAYGGERIAGFTPMQVQAQQAAANLGPAQQLGIGTQMAGLSGLGQLGIAQNAANAGNQYAMQATNPYAMQGYMSPYVENALAPQLREAARQSAQLGQQNAAKAVQQGAFGGSGTALMEAERQRNLAQLQSDIYNKGMQSAYDQARQAQQFGATLGLQGQQAGLQGMQGAAQTAATLGQLGQTQFGQQKDIINAQATAGAQQQALQQAALQQKYQDFLTQKAYPQQQLAFMSDMLRGAPLGQQTQQQYTAAAPSGMSQVAGLGLAALGASKAGLFGKKGGKVPDGLEHLALHNMTRDA